MSVLSGLKTCQEDINRYSFFPMKAIAEKSNKQLQHQIHEVQGKIDEANRTLNDFDVAKKKLAVENAELLRQLEEVENQGMQLSKLKMTLSSQLEETKKSVENEGKVRTISMVHNMNFEIVIKMLHILDLSSNTTSFRRNARLCSGNSATLNTTSMVFVSSWMGSVRRRLI